MNKHMWRLKMENCLHSLEAAIGNLRQNAAIHSARVMMHRLETKRYTIQFMKALMLNEEPDPMVKAHIYKQYLVDYPDVGPNLDDSIPFNVGDSAINVISRSRHMNIRQFEIYLAQYNCQINYVTGLIEEGPNAI